MKKVIVKKHHANMPAQYYARISLDGKEKMTVLCSVAEADASKDPETFLHHRLIEAVQKLMTREVSTVSERHRTPLVKQVFEEWLDSLTVGERTKSFYELALSLFLKYHGETEIGNLRAVSSRPMIKDLQEKGRSANTIRTYLRSVQIMLGYAEKAGIVEKCPVLEQPGAEKRNIRIYSEEDLDRVEGHLRGLAQTEEPALNRYRLHMMLRYTGMRAGEVWSLPLKNIDLKSGYIVLREVPELGWKPKKGKEAQIPIVGRLKEFLLEDLKKRGSAERYYLDKGDGRTYASETSSLTKMMGRTMKSLGLQDAAKTLHGYRASAITHMLEAGVPPHEVQAVARHEDLKTTLGYLHQRGVSEKALATLQS